ncbi:MAG: ATP-binding protein [Endomicrobium sp.]|jgi:Holliday junction resolvase-like predicted endonuclease|nr:ATP-binding protein [Endomicrobium sp.]
MKRLPIGIQAFEDIRGRDAVYVDKTKEIYNMARGGKFYFLSRPRRFGKSLLISTLKNSYKGKKELFEGLYIWGKWDWSKKHPVIHLDFAEIGYKNSDELEKSFNVFLDNTAKRNNVEITKSAPISVKFAELIEKLHKSTREQVVVLVDEYDKPLIDNLVNKEVYSQVKRSLHNFYQVVKAGDEHIKLVLLTGVSQFSGLSIFSGLNNLENITMSEDFASICGYTQEELESNFKEYIELAEKNLELNYSDIVSHIKRWYNGYSWDGKVFFSTLLFFKHKEFAGHWFETGTPTFLIEQLEKMEEVESLLQVSQDVLKGPDNEEMEPTALLFQTGYLTVKRKESTDTGSVYTVDFPNYEVKSAFLTRLVAVCARKTQREAESIRDKIYDSLKEKDEKKLEKSLTELYANKPYDLHIKRESYYHSIFLATAKISGYEVEGEVHTDKGRIDVVVKKGDNVIVVEIKYGKENKVEQLLKEGMKQIKESKYSQKYNSANVTLLAIVFAENKEIRCGFESI